MNSSGPINPVHILRRRQRRLWLATAPALIIITIWWLRPLGVEDVAVPVPTEHRARPKAQNDVREIDPAVFAVNLWKTPPRVEPQEPAVAQAPPPPLNVQLIGIITEDGVAKAALYDGDSDRLLIVADGERLRDQVVRILPAGVVELTDGGRSTRRLLLRPDKEAPS
jgi:hypothetical protein